MRKKSQKQKTKKHLGEHQEQPGFPGLGFGTVQVAVPKNKNKFFGQHPPLPQVSTQILRSTALDLSNDTFVRSTYEVLFYVFTWPRIQNSERTQKQCSPYQTAVRWVAHSTRCHTPDTIFHTAICTMYNHTPSCIFFLYFGLFCVSGGSRWTWIESRVVRRLMFLP